MIAVTAVHAGAAALAALQRELDAHLAEIRRLARTAARSTSAPWQAIVEATTGQPRRALPPAGDGANPAEVRAVLVAVRADYARRLDAIERSFDRRHAADELSDALWTFRYRRLDGLVETELAAYIADVVPSPSVAQAFGRAATALAHDAARPRAAAGPNRQLHRCKTCAAPRFGDALYGDCAHCGAPFFTGREEIE